MRGEWCADWYDGSVRARVVRGGSWTVMDRIPLLTSFRVRYVPDARNSSYGFRCVRSAAPAEAGPISPPFVPSSSAAGKLSATEVFRLPSDHEWSCAVGIADREDAATLPKEKGQKPADVFP